MLEAVENKNLELIELAKAKGINSKVVEEMIDKK